MPQNAERDMLNNKAETKIVSWNTMAARAIFAGLLGVLCSQLMPTSSFAANGSDVITSYNLSRYYPLWRDLTNENTEWGNDVGVPGSEQVPKMVRIYNAPPTFARPSEIIILWLDSSNQLWGQVWNGTTYESTVLSTNTVNQNSLQPFDGAFETGGTNFVAAFEDSLTTIGFKESYITWNGTVWSAAAHFPQAEPSITTNLIRNVRVISPPIASTTTVYALMNDAAGALFGVSWNGTTWGNWNTFSSASSNAGLGIPTGTTIDNVTQRCWDIAASTSGKLYVIAATNGTNHVIGYATSTNGGATWTAGHSAGLVQNSANEWLVAAADKQPGTDRIGVAADQFVCPRLLYLIR